jgi:hypothetical protein
VITRSRRWFRVGGHGERAVEGIAACRAGLGPCEPFAGGLNRCGIIEVLDAGGHGSKVIIQLPGLPPGGHLGIEHVDPV